MLDLKALLVKILQLLSISKTVTFTNLIHGVFNFQTFKHLFTPRKVVGVC